MPVGQTVFANPKVNQDPVRVCKKVQILSSSPFPLESSLFSYGIYFVGLPVAWEAGKSRRKKENCV